MYGTLQTETLVAGEDWTPLYTLKDANGAILNLQGAEVRLRLIRLDGTVLDLGKTKGEANENQGQEWQYPQGDDGTQGRIVFLVGGNETSPLALGSPVYRRTYYDVDVQYRLSTSTPVTVRVQAKGALIVERAKVAL